MVKAADDPNLITAIRLTTRRQAARVGDVFRLSAAQGVVLWGRVVRQGAFLGVMNQFHLVHVYDTVSETMPKPELMTVEHLLIPPAVVNNLGFSRGYWEIMANAPSPEEEAVGQRQLFLDHPSGRVVSFAGDEVTTDVDPASLPRAAFGNFNSVDERVRLALSQRGAP